MSDDLGANKLSVLISITQAAVIQLQLSSAEDMAKALQGLLGPHGDKQVEAAQEALESWKRAIGYEEKRRAGV